MAWLPGVDLQVDLAAAAIAVLALIFTWRTGRRQTRLERETLRLQRDSDVIAWSNSCLSSVCRAEMLLRPQYPATTAENDYERTRFEVLAELSCNIDRGRLFFPNRDAHRFGLEKESAFRGKRHPVLDRLVWIYERLSDVTYSQPADGAERKAIRDQVITCKREFISEVQSEVDPRRRVQFFEQHQ